MSEAATERIMHLQHIRKFETAEHLGMGARHILKVWQAFCTEHEVPAFRPAVMSDGAFRSKASSA